jgi:phosphate transport system substrate-binding protein
MKPQFTFHSILTFSILSLTLVGQARAVDLTGAGSTFVYPVISKWADAYKTETGTSVNYQSIGSGGGIKQIESKTVDFGASDMPLKPEELKKEGLLQFPIINGGDVPVINVSGVKPGQLKLDGQALGDLFLGKIKKWNDPAIVKLNPGVTLPETDVTVVHRSDGSGTTFIWTNYLSKVNADWKAKAGEGSAVNWPVGVGGKGNEGVASYVQRLDGAIGYVEYAYALQNKMNFAQVKNHAGNFITPNAESFQAASASAAWDKAPGMYLVLTDAPGKKSWPITGSTFILMQESQAKPEQAKEALKFFSWAYHKGTKLATDLDYVSLPANVVSLIEKKWRSEMKGADGSSILWEQTKH